MPIVHPCAHPGCETLTMGELCLEHEGVDPPEAVEALALEAAPTSGAAP